MFLQMANKWTEWTFQPDLWVLPFLTGSKFFLASFSYVPHLICPLVCDSWFWWKFNAKIKSILLQSYTSPLLFISHFLILKNILVFAGAIYIGTDWRINHFHLQHKEWSPPFQEAREEDRNEKKDLVPSLMIQENICEIYNNEINKTLFSHFSIILLCQAFWI